MRLCEPCKPRVLYKYRSLSYPERIEPIFVQNTLYFPKSSEVNDPFDCKVPYLDHFEATFFREVLDAKRASGVSLSALEEEVLSGDEGKVRALVEEWASNLQNAVFLSLSETRDDLIMWSHYADSHKGICLEFSLDYWPGAKISVLPVTYSSSRMKLSLTREAWSMGGIAAVILLSKFEGWQYEKEWRFVDPWSFGNREFPPDCLTGVIFGCNIDEADERRVREWIGAGKCRPNFYRTKLKGLEFGLEIVPT